jgi:hypothetical protein
VNTDVIQLDHLLQRTPAEEAFVSEGERVLAIVRADEAAGTVVRTRQDCEQAVTDRKTVAERRAAIVQFFEPLKSAAHTLHAAICGRERQALAPYDAVDASLKTAIARFLVEDAAATRAAEQAASAAATAAREAEALAAAAALAGAGDLESADAVIEAVVAAPPVAVVLPRAKAQIAGLRTRTNYRWRYLDDDKDRAFTVIPREYLTVDEAKITAYAKAMKGTGTIPGITFYSTEDPVR